MKSHSRRGATTATENASHPAHIAKRGIAPRRAAHIAAACHQNDLEVAPKTQAVASTTICGATGARSMRPTQLPFPPPPKPRDESLRPTNVAKPCPMITRSRPRPTMPIGTASSSAECTILHIEQIIDNEAVGDHSHVEDEGTGPLLRQAGTEVSHMNRIRRGYGQRDGDGDAGWPAHLLCSSAHIGTPSTFSTYTCTWQPL